jgi:hypothetical protein
MRWAYYVLSSGCRRRPSERRRNPSIRRHPVAEVWTPADLETFREGSFAGPAREMPPIIVVTYPDKDGTSHTEIRDGRILGECVEPILP